jgi:hypothetical protein
MPSSRWDTESMTEDKFFFLERDSNSTPFSLRSKNQNACKTHSEAFAFKPLKIFV